MSSSPACAALTFKAKYRIRVRLNWGQPEKPEFITADLFKAYEVQAMRLEELRKMLIKAGLELTEPEGSPVGAGGKA